MENEINPLKNPNKYQDRVLELMKGYENLIGDLYSVYAEKDLSYADFWKKISEEERTHAYWIETLANSIGSGKVHFDEERFNIAPLEQVTNDIKTKIDYAQKNEINALNALSISNDLEGGMIERKFFEVFESDSAEIKQTLSMLEDATIKHESLVHEMWEKERSLRENENSGIFHKIKAFFMGS